MKAGFAAIDVTPPLGICIGGWIKHVPAAEVLDPVFVRACAIESGGERLGLLLVDGVRAPWTVVCAVRRAIEERYGLPGGRLMVAATHNHASGAISESFEAKGDPAYVATVRGALVSAFGQALERLEPAEWGAASVPEFRFAHNRRVRQRDGTTRTHGKFSDPGALCYEGPIDPEVAVLAFRSARGKVLGVWVNYACHPADNGINGKISAGWPGAMAKLLAERGVPDTLFLNGAAGNIATSDPANDGRKLDIGEIGAMLAGDVQQALEKMTWRKEAALAARAQTVELPYFRASAEQIAGTARGTQRFINPALYDQAIPSVLAKMKQKGCARAEVQVFDLDELSIAAIPGEFFVELGLAVKEAAHPRKALVVAYANGALGYIPHREAYERGGYEATFPGTVLSAGGGERLAETAIELVRQAPAGGTS